MFDLDSGALIATAVGIRERGELPSGRKVTGKADFFIGAADMPIDPPKDWQPKSLKAKIAAGAQFAQTQFCMDIDIVKRYVARLAQDRLTEQDLAADRRRAAALGAARRAGSRSSCSARSSPTRSWSGCEYSGDPAAEGKQICIDFIAQLSEVPGVAGAHIMAPNNEARDPRRDCEGAQAGEKSRAGVPDQENGTAPAQGKAAHAASGNVRDRQRLQDQLLRGGQGAPLLYLHGALGVSAWTPFMERLSQRFDVIVPDHPGFGESDTPDWLDNVGDLAYFYLDVIKALGLSGVHLVRHVARRLDRGRDRGARLSSR